MPLHVGKGRNISTAISDIIDYVENPQKTDFGKFIYGYECDTWLADAEFLLSKRQYANLTGRNQGADDVIAYHLRQAFKPGEVTPEEANQIGRELALKLTKGNHAFVVCTHVDKHHVHNHIIINSTTLDCQKKFRNFWGSTWAIRRMNDKDQTILELNRQLNRSLTLNEKLNSENRAENIEALRTKLKQTEEQLTSETDSRKRADAEVVAWKFKYEKAEQAKRYAQTHQKTVEVPVEKKVPYEKCDNCDRTAYQKAKEKCDNRKIQLEKKYKQMTTGYESLMFLLAWYSIATTLFTAILSPVFLNDCITFFGTIGKGIINLFREFVTGADSFGQLSNGISNSIVSGIVYWLIAAIVMGILFIITGFLIIGIGYQVGKIYRKYCWDIISIMVAIMSTAIVIYFGEWIKSVIPINLIVLLLLVYVVYIGIRCYVKDWREERGYY